MGRTWMDQDHQECLDKQEEAISSSCHYTTAISPVFYVSAEDDAVKQEVNGKQFELTVFRNQVAGHSNDGKHFGLIKYKEALLKPIAKPAYFEREAHFYESLQRVGGDRHAGVCDPDTLIKHLVPKYYGSKTVELNGTYVRCLVLEDLTRGMREPCIMDVKIGRRTWDPDASQEKIKHEDAKYFETKCEYGFCIPGFQVYDVKTSSLQKFDKSYGKQLNKITIFEALRMFLNGKDKSIRRILIVQLLVDLWHIQSWARKQHRHRLYSSSILLIYDARRLRQLLEAPAPVKPPPKPVPPPELSAFRRTNSLYRPLSLAILNDKCTKTGFSGQLNKEGPIFPCRVSKHNPLATGLEAASRRSTTSLKRMHSFRNNYDEDLRSIRTDYASILDNLVTDNQNEVWAAARMIDFAHAFTSTDGGAPDVNYLEGIDSLVRIMEDFLAESDV